MKNVFGILLVVFTTLLASCSKEDAVEPVPEAEPEIEEVTAEFDASVAEIEAGKSVSFTDHSTGKPTAWQWKFEGGEPATSTKQHPEVIYDTPGVYNVELTVSNGESESTQTKSELITVEAVAEEEIVAAFTMDQEEDSVVVGESVQFTDTSTGNPTSWEWSFEGGNPASSDEQNPKVTYDAPGVYSVNLSVSNESTNDVYFTSTLVTVVEGKDSSDFTLAGQWVLEDNSTGVLTGSIVEYDPETNEGTLVHIEMNTHCFELGDISWIDVEATEDGFTLKEMYRNCITHLYAESTIEIVNDNKILMKGEFQGEAFSRTWVRYESEATYELDTYLEGTWEDVSEEKVFAGIEVKADLTTGQGLVVGAGENSLCWQVDDLAWDEIQPAVSGNGYWVSGLVKDCVSEERVTYYIRISDENNFHYEDELGDKVAEFKRVKE
ncbi:MAG: PKD domain-containing protein [Tunicatimonas sp.]|uniref:PKD domain-containing protein n=1 Tax=Tunicatimonas sp. TaxID=1940096 RepID=UPI003C743FB9